MTLHDLLKIPRFLYGESDAERVPGKQRIPADRRPATGHRAARVRSRRGHEGADLAGRYGIWEDPHHGPGYREAGSPALVIAHNKTLAAQLASEFAEFFPNNAVEYFVSYYDYYQPEAYVPRTDTFIEKDAQINEDIDRLRHSATSSLFTRRDVIVVASVSAIYGLGSPRNTARRWSFWSKVASTTSTTS